MSPGMFPGQSAKRTVRFRASSICRFPFAGRCFAPPYPAARDNPGNGGKGEVWFGWHNAGVLSSCAANRKQRIHPPLKGLPRAVHAAQRHSREGYRRGHACMNPGRFLAAYFRGTPPHEYETAGDCIFRKPAIFPQVRVQGGHRPGPGLGRTAPAFPSCWLLKYTLENSTVNSMNVY